MNARMNRIDCMPQYLPLSAMPVLPVLFAWPLYNGMEYHYFAQSSLSEADTADGLSC